MPREHGDSGEFVETTTVEDVLEIFDEVRGPVVLSADVADALGCSRETARRKLDELHDGGDVDRRKVSRRVVYWRPHGREATVADGEVRGNAETTLDDSEPVERIPTEEFAEDEDG
jgi:predicted ArsR family transcriptional regulator